jgi:hypothetical protein
LLELLLSDWLLSGCFSSPVVISALSFMSLDITTGLELSLFTGLSPFEQPEAIIDTAT